MDLSNNIQQFVIFKLEDEEYGVDILKVKTIEKMTRVARVPKAAHYVEGVINLRGEVVPIIDLRKKFNLPKSVETDNTRIIIVSIEDITVGLIVDSASEVIEIPKEFIEDTPELVGNIDQSNISSIGKVNERIIILLNISRILSTVIV